MAPTGTSLGVPAAETGMAQFIDRWIYVGMAVLLIVIVLIGFLPDSIEKLADVSGGRRPPLPMVLHVHAALMGSWLVLLLTQTLFMANGQARWHMQLGLLALLLAPGIVFSGVVLVPANTAAKVAFAAAASPEVRALLERTVHTSLNVCLVQIRAGLCFALFVALAIALRRREPETHKRLMILATIVPMSAAFTRMMWLPQTMPYSSFSQLAWPLAAAAPMFAWDLYRLRRIQKAYWWFAVGMAPTGVAVALLWNTPGWIAFATRLLISPA